MENICAASPQYTGAPQRNHNTQKPTTDEIAARLDLERTYVYAIVHLLEHGEDTLVKGIERARIPVSVAAKISTAADEDVQAARAGSLQIVLLLPSRSSREFATRDS